MNADNFNDIQSLVAYEIDRRKIIQDSTSVNVSEILSTETIQNVINDLEKMEHSVEEELKNSLSNTSTQAALGRNIIEEAKKAYSEFIQLIPPL